ncbi:hypothetical protein EKO27_g11383 [Xylaria grammica]|uniref:Uncharacterized protein n=1 Tax=Xylaria grammica TaxID=363999 RepID=A0A439CNI4_9PEZI|nr:hypothetical protein EKO27_g11383 [Xylaria grammica]
MAHELHRRLIEVGIYTKRPHKPQLVYNFSYEWTVTTLGLNSLTNNPEFYFSVYESDAQDASFISHYIFIIAADSDPKSSNSPSSTLTSTSATPSSTPASTPTSTPTSTLTSAAESEGTEKGSMKQRQHPQEQHGDSAYPHSQPHMLELPNNEISELEGRHGRL